MVDPTRDPVVHGVPLRAYARVLAARAEGVSLERALAHAAVDHGAWPAADGGFAALLAEAALEDPGLLEAFDAHLAEARDELARPTPPLDQDLGAWLDFLRGWVESDDPLARLAQSHLRVSDILRLQRLWAPRIEADPVLREEAARILSRAPREVVIPRPAEPPIPVVAERRAAPSAISVVAIPRLAMPLPTPDAPAVPAARVDEAPPALGMPVVMQHSPFAGTAYAIDVPRDAAMPFAAQPATPPSPGPEPEAPAARPGMPIPRKAPSLLTGTALPPVAPRGPAVPFVAPPPPPPPPMPTAFRAAPLPPPTLPPALPAAFQAAPPPLPVSPQPQAGAQMPFGLVLIKAPAALVGTSVVLEVPRGPAMPFAAPAPPAPGAPPPAPPLPATANPIPRKAPAGLADTSLALDIPRTAALPFAAGTAPAAPTAPEEKAPGPGAKGPLPSR